MAIIIAEPNKGGVWDACLVEPNLHVSSSGMQVRQLAADWRCSSYLLPEIVAEILSLVGDRSIESFFVVSCDPEFEGPIAVIHNGNAVHVQMIDPLAVVAHAVPEHWTTFLLVDLRFPVGCSLVRRQVSGMLECIGGANLSGAERNGYLQPKPSTSNGTHQNGGATLRLEAKTSTIADWIGAASLLGMTGVVFRDALFYSGRPRIDNLVSRENESTRSCEIAFLSGQELSLGVLNSWRLGGATSSGDVTLTREKGRTTLTMSCRKEISYSVIHPAGPVLDSTEKTLSRALSGRPALIVVDQKVNQLFGAQIAKYASQNLNCLGSTVIDGCEQRKSWDQVHRICSDGVRIDLPRDGVLVAFGGGVTLDLCGVAASLFRRGVPYVRVPTTLVGMVDTAVGIKQGFNFESKKNMLGSFYAPFAVINDPRFLSTLPEAEIACGLAEIIKMAVVRDRDLMAVLEGGAKTLLESRFQSPSDLAARVLLRAEQLMMQELQQNLFEDCHARLVDFGHTFSPGLERVSSYTMRHGYAVGLDMLVSAGVAIKRGFCHIRVFERMVALYRQAGLPLHSSLMTADVLLASARDASQHRSGKLNLVIPLDFGRATYLQELQRDDLEYSLAMTEEAADGWDSSTITSSRL